MSRFPRGVRNLSSHAVLGLLLLGGMVGCNRPSGEDAPKAPDSPGPSFSGPTTVKEKPSRAVETALAEGFPQVFADVAEKVIPGVVSIYSERKVPVPDYGPSFGNNPFFPFFGEPPENPRRGRQRFRMESGLGSGVILSPEGYILTNNHVIENADRIKIQLSDERELEAEIVGADAPSDVAVIRVKKAPGKLPTVPIGDSDKLRVGEMIVAVGNPYGLSSTVTTGIISAKGRRNTGINNYENFLQTDAAINPGNSGGALVNLRGELVGINTAIFSRSGGYQGIGFAIPVNMARKIMDDLIAHGTVTRGWLGVSIDALDEEMAEALNLPSRQGALVNEVVPGSPAEKAGLRRGDVVLKIDGEEVRDANDLLNRVALLRPEAWVDLEVWRDGKTLKFKTKVGKRDEKRLSESAQPRRGEDGGGVFSAEALGLDFAVLSSSLRERYQIEKKVLFGLVVVGVDEGSGAEKAGLAEGDVILEVNRAKVGSERELQAALEKGRGKSALLLVNRAGHSFYRAVARS